MGIWGLLGQGSERVWGLIVPSPHSLRAAARDMGLGSWVAGGKPEQYCYCINFNIHSRRKLFVQSILILSILKFQYAAYSDLNGNTMERQFQSSIIRL